VPKDSLLGTCVGAPLLVGRAAAAASSGVPAPRAESNRSTRFRLSSSNSAARRLCISLESIVAGVTSIALGDALGSVFSIENNALFTGVCMTLSSGLVEDRRMVSGVVASNAVDDVVWTSTACCHRNCVTGDLTCAAVVYKTLCEFPCPELLLDNILGSIHATRPSPAPTAHTPPSPRHDTDVADAPT
jgi:hypothetical protein